MMPPVSVPRGASNELVEYLLSSSERASAQPYSTWAAGCYRRLYLTGGVSRAGAIAFTRKVNNLCVTFFAILHVLTEWAWPPLLYMKGLAEGEVLCLKA